MPTPRYKVLIVQTDAQELDFSTELGLDGENVYFVAPGYLADNVQEAIVETISKSGAARRPFGFYYDANANTGRWLEVSKGVSSQTSPHPIAQTGLIKNLTISVKSNATATATVYKNGVSVQTISLTAAKVAVVSGLNIAVSPGDTLSCQITAGNCTEPNVTLEVQTSA